MTLLEEIMGLSMANKENGVQCLQRGASPLYDYGLYKISWNEILTDM